MKPTEAIKLTRLVKALCPAQSWDEATPDTWVLLMAKISYADGEAAALELGNRQRFIAPAEITEEVKRVRARRTHGVDEHLYRIDEQYLSTPEGIRDANAAKRDAIARIADGETYEAVFGAPPPIESRRIVDESNVGRMLALKRPRDLPAAES